MFLLAGWAPLGPITFERGRKINVEGTSNVHGWTCESTTSGHRRRRVGGERAHGPHGPRNVTVTGIDCKNGTMTGKIREALAAAPITYTLTSATLGAARGNQFPIQV